MLYGFAMKSTSLLPVYVRGGALAVIAAAALAGCSTVKDLSPFGSDVPYSQDVKPTIAQPAVVDVPAFKPVPPPQKPIAAPPPATSPAAPADSPPPAPAASPPSRQSSLSAAPDQKMASAAPVAEGSADAPAPSPSAAPPAPVAMKGTPGHPVTRPADSPPSIPDADLAFKDDGTYPNLAQVPARPVNMPTFLEASAVEKSLVTDRETAKDKEPDSPPSPSPDTLPDAAAKPPAAAPAAPVAVATTLAAAPVTERVEDSAPCLSQRPANAEPAAILHFAPGSAALSSDDLIIIADAIPAVRSGNGTIRVFGHGDTDQAASQSSRFDLAAARAGAVAQALAGYGIPAPRIAIGVACADPSLAGASVQLYAES